MGQAKLNLSLVDNFLEVMISMERK